MSVSGAPAIFAIHQYPNVRDAEINQLKRLQEQGLHALGHLSLIPDSIRVLVAVKPT